MKKFLLQRVNLIRNIGLADLHYGATPETL